MVPDPDDRLRALEEQLAQLTSRIYRIEQLLALEKPPQSPADETLAASAPPIPEQGPQSAPAESPIAGQSRWKGGSPPSVASSSPGQLRHESPQSAVSSATLESMIGGQWLNRLGVIAVLVGLSYFLKLAIENNWIGPAARVAIGLAAGIGVIFWSERFRRRGFAAFSYSLKALGLGALYLSLWAAFQLYHLVPASSAFLGMVLVTMAAGTLSIVQQSELLAALALLGGFLTPILVSTHENREVSLLSYLLLLDLGAAWVAAAKRWPRILAGALVGTILLFGGWGFEYYSDSQLATTCVFATLFFLVFAAAQLLTSRDGEDRRSFYLECAVLVGNAAAYFVGLFAMMEEQHRQLLAIMTFALTAVCLLIGRILLVKCARRDLEVAYLILAVVFLTLAVPIQFHDRAITVAWDVEAAVLLWLSRQTHARLLRTSGSLVLILAIARLTIADSGRETTLLLNARFGLYLLTIAVAGLMTYIYVKSKEADWERWAAVGVIAINALALGALSLEVHDYFLPLFRLAITGDEHRSVLTAEAFSYSALWMLYGAGLMAVGFWKRQALLRWLAIGLLAITAIKVFSVDISLLQRGFRIASFIALGVILLAVSFFYQRARLGGGERIERS